MGIREKLPLLVLLPVPNRSVIPTEAQRSEGTCCFLPSTHQTLNGSAAVSFVIPTGAYPDFLPRSTGQGHVCALP
jgi:hypothetical protein